MNTLRLTVYEILGYFAPGIVALAAIAVFGWSLFAPDMAGIAIGESGKVSLFGFAFLAYTLGHLVQGVSNLHPSPEDRAERSNTFPHLVDAARANLSARCGRPFDKHSVRDLVELAQASVTNSGKTDMYDVLVYREGFYRGSTTAYILLTGSLLLRAVRRTTLVRIASQTYTIATSAILLLSLLSATIAFVYYRRYIRFADHRVRYLLNIASLPSDEKAKKQDQSEGDAEKPEGD